jgi:hypothetical protein
MTNWQMREEITFRCPDCGYIQHEMTPECPECRKTRTAPVQPGYSVHRVSFGMNGGQREESYRIMLTDEQTGMLSGLPGHEAFNLFWTLWDQVITADIDAGTDYEGMGCEITRDLEQGC